MPGLDPGIHRKNNFYSKVMDCRVKPGNDDGWVNVYEVWYKLRLRTRRLAPNDGNGRSIRYASPESRLKSSSTASINFCLRGSCAPRLAAKRVSR